MNSLMFLLLCCVIVDSQPTGTPPLITETTPPPPSPTTPPPSHPTIQTPPPTTTSTTETPPTTTSTTQTPEVTGTILPQPNLELEMQMLKAQKTQTHQNEEFNEGFDPLENDLLQKQQRQAEATIEYNEDKSFHSWVAQELEEIKDAQKIISHENFAFRLDKQYDFKWNPSKKGVFRFVVQVFEFTNQNVLLPYNPDQDDFVDVYAQPDGSSFFIHLGSVYIKKMFNLNFYSDFQIIKFNNHYDQSMIVQISLEETGFVPSAGLVDDSLKLSAQKMKGILNEIEETEIKREKNYLTEWGFKDREKRHQSEMLVLTGVELFVILGTAIVQMYCIKGLLDNRLIV